MHLFQKIGKYWLLKRYKKKATMEGTGTLNRYLQHIEKERIAPKLLGNRFVVLDTETSGTSATSDRMLSIGAVGIQQLSVTLSDSFECFVQQPKTGAEQTILVHRLLKSDIQKGKLERDALLNFLDFVQDAILVMHHASFDREFLNHALHKHLGIKLLNPWLDTLLLAIRLEHGNRPLSEVKREPYSLDALCERYQIPKAQRHTAAGDAYTTALLFLKLVAMAKKRGIKTTAALLNGWY